MTDRFPTIRTEGSILPADLLQRVAASDKSLAGLTPADYHLLDGEKLNEATNRSWNRLLGVWGTFQKAVEKLPTGDIGTSVTRDRWLLPLWQELGYGRLAPVAPVVIDDKTYPVSHGWQHTAIHLVGCRADLDSRSKAKNGSSQPSPHSLVQELINRSERHLWAFVTNGFKLRILRDNNRLTRQAYVEFDLQAMFEGKVYADFALLWRLCHQSRVEAEKPHECRLEQWSKAAQEQGLRVLDQLRGGVEKTIAAFGRGFLACPANNTLRDKLRAGNLDAQDYYRQLLRLVYRLLFLFVAEDRDLLFDPNVALSLRDRKAERPNGVDDTDDVHATHDPSRAPGNPLAEREGYGDAARERYTRFYSTSRLRRLAERLRGTQHIDLYQVLSVVMTKLGTTGCPELALPALGGFLFSADALPDLQGCQLANVDLLEAVRALALTNDGHALRPVDYRNLGSEELGSVYESLLELHPVLNAEAATFELSTASGHERKTTGTYYTPTSLITCLLDSALDPVLDEAVKQPDPERALMNLKVCDLACGSGHFLIAAAHRIAKRLAFVRTGEEEPVPEALRHALRDVIGHCIYGVDINPMAVELCKVALWMEALEPGKPLSFLDHHIQCGNSLLGTTPALLARGIPDDAFTAIEGDVKPRVAELKKQNKREREDYLNRQGYLFDPPMKLGNMAADFARLNSAPDGTLADVAAIQDRYAQLVRGNDYQFGRLLADTWCAAFVWKKDDSADGKLCPTERDFRKVETHAATGLLPHVRAEVERLSRKFQFFHWHLAFPDVFRLPANGETPDNEHTGWNGGFDAVLGNPPWVRQEFLKPVKQLLQMFESFTSTVDSSVLFLERAVETTAIGKRIGLLTPNKWFRIEYGELLRKMLRERTRARLLVDFGHSKNLFVGADTFPAAVVLEPVAQRIADDEGFRFVQAHDSDRKTESLEGLVQKHAVLIPHSQLRPDRWELEDFRVSELLSRLRSTGRSLAATVGRAPLYGLKSGFNAAFYIDTATRDGLVSGDPKCESLIKKFLRGRDIERWLCRWENQWHIVVPSSHNVAWPWSSCSDESEAEEVFRETFPSVHGHLKQYEKELRNRDDQGRFWWELRACDYYDLFDSSKILIQTIVYKSQFCVDLEHYVLNNTVVMLPSDDLFLLAILNSRTMWWILSRVMAPRKDQGLCFYVEALSDLPIPNADEDLKSRIRDAARQLIEISRQDSAPASVLLALEQQVNNLVDDAYCLTADERRLLAEFLPARDPLVVLEEQVVAERQNIGETLSPPDSLVTQLKPSPKQLEQGERVLLLKLILEQSNQPLDRDALELRIVLALTTTAHQRIASQQPVSPASTQPSEVKNYWPGLDRQLAALVKNDVIGVETRAGQQLFTLKDRLGLDSTLADKYRPLVIDALRWSGRLKDQRELALFLTEADCEELETVLG